MSEMRPTGDQIVGRAERRGTRGGEETAGVCRLFAQGAAGVTSLVHALLVRIFSHRWTRM